MNTVEFLYCRVSTNDQCTEVQKELLLKRYPEGEVYEEKSSGTERTNRTQLNLIIEHKLRKGDKLVVWKLDRLTRNVADMEQLVKEIESKGAALEILDLNIDTSQPTGKAFLQMLGVFAEFETNIRRERQMAGINKARAEGRVLGRVASLDKAKIIELKLSGMSFRKVAEAMGCGVSSVQRTMKEYEEKQQQGSTKSKETA